MWECLDEISARENATVNELIGFIDRMRDRATLTSDVRIFVLGYFRSAATERGHLAAGHGILFNRGVSGRTTKNTGSGT